MENDNLLWINQQTKWPFSIAMLVYQRVQSGWWLVSTPLKNMTSSNGIMKFPTEWKHIKNVPRHQAASSYFMIFHGDLLRELE